jgi:uncharacterized phage infection (PIP) family protein YhgE
MGADVIAALIAGLASLLAGSTIFNESARKVISKLFGISYPAQQQSYSERLSALTDSLTKASREVDTVLGELAQVARNREAAVQQLEAGLKSMEEREKQLQERIAFLKDVPIPVAEHFAKLTEPGEKRSAWRDYILFGSGVVVSTVIAIVPG